MFYDVTLDTGKAMYTVTIESDYALDDRMIKVQAEENLLDGLLSSGMEDAEFQLANCKMVTYSEYQMA